MKIVGLDTSHRTLTIVLIENDRIVESYHAEAFKTQSETILGRISQSFRKSWMGTFRCECVRYYNRSGQLYRC